MAEGDGQAPDFTASATPAGAALPNCRRGAIGRRARSSSAYDYLNRRSLKHVWEWTGAWALRQDLASRLVYDGWTERGSAQMAMPKASPSRQRGPRRRAPFGRRRGNLIAEIADGGTIKKKYTWGSDVSGTAQGAGGVGGLLMIELKQGAAYVQLYPIYDSQHNILGLHDSAGTIVARYDYDAYGETFNVNGAAFAYNEDSNYAEANPFRYSTKYTDNFSASYAGGDAYRDGLVYYGLRFYHPEMGRFVNRDPIEESGGLNLYGFVGNSPTNGYDYLGMDFISDEEWARLAAYNSVQELYAHGWGSATGQRMYTNKIEGWDFYWAQNMQTYSKEPRQMFVDFEKTDGAVFVFKEQSRESWWQRELNAAGQTLKGFVWDGPKAWVGGVNQAFWHPVDTVGAVWDQLAWESKTLFTDPKAYGSWLAEGVSQSWERFLTDPNYAGQAGFYVGMSFVPAPKLPPGLPHLIKAKAKTPVRGGGHLRNDGLIAAVIFMSGITSMEKLKCIIKEVYIKACMMQIQVR